MDPEETKVNILTTSTSEFLGGTSAQLLAGDTMSVYELCYAMMLPSGNDAAQSLGIYFGNLANQIDKAGGTVPDISRLKGNLCEENYPEDIEQARKDLTERKAELAARLSSIQQQDQMRVDTAKTAKSSNSYMTDPVSSTPHISNSSMSCLFNMKYQSNLNSPKQQIEEDKECNHTIQKGSVNTQSTV